MHRPLSKNTKFMSCCWRLVFRSIRYPVLFLGKQVKLRTIHSESNVVFKKIINNIFFQITLPQSLTATYLSIRGFSKLEVCFICPVERTNDLR